ncbi:c-type cytochrome [Marinibacterium profundimaris]|uniref:Cytochrome c domain-containing protein n=1 Tax=Marinibacterium profundimaris TaxID=1679460 RepID=A0A225NFH4_9RHOB|nr:c-type cytochrome [Marinibacterium profundimaris]OWU72208.1 hypothetical protein ATO3_16670 [Marinibacterium profundimaris]
MKHLMAGLAGLLLAAPVAMAQDADGDPAAGENDFKQCRTCHAITDADGNDIVKGGKVGPNLYGVVGRQAGTYEDFRYSDFMIAAGEAGLSWNVEDFTVYVQDPTAFLRDYLDDPKARGKMAFKLMKEEQAADIWAYLVSVGPGGES